MLPRFFIVGWYSFNRQRYYVASCIDRCIAMSQSLDRLQQIHSLKQITRRHVQGQTPEPLGTVGVFHCHRKQALHAVPVHQPALIIVLSGEKRLHATALESACLPGQMLMLPGNCELQMENIPDSGLDEYLALFVPFNPATIAGFLQGVGKSLDWERQLPQLLAEAPQEILLSLQQRIEWTLAGQADTALIELRQQELLALLAQQGLLGNLMRNRHPSAAQRLSALIAMDCARDWKMADVCAELALSESSLRRELARERCSFRDILEQVRLTTGLALLQETRWTVADIAGRVGYESPSRFAARFRDRFGMSPAEVKRSRECLTVSGAMLAESGA